MGKKSAGESKTGKVEQASKPEKVRKAERVPKAARVGKTEKATRSGRSERATSSGTAGTPTEPGAAAQWSDTLRVGAEFRLEDIDPRATPGFDSDKAAAAAALPDLQARLAELQERLWAESRGGGTRSLLLVIQGMDTSGKGGIMRHVVGAVDPQGVDITAFKAPTVEERQHPFLWRIRRALPSPGVVGVFDRSHYEDVLIVRVHDLVPRATWSRRYAQINAFERSVVDRGTTMVKVMLHISAEEQKNRLAERLERPDKHWKFNPGDLDERALWPAYQEAYQAALARCSTAQAPWHVVPADRKWYARFAVTQLVVEHLERLNPQWPVADFDVEAEKARMTSMH
ncbi:MAG: polyphosphate kinase 2 family protein [Phycicoccus sp.]